MPEESTRPAAPAASNEQQTTFAVTLMEHLVVPTFVLDAERRVLVWNKACERLTGVPAHEIVGTRDHWRAFYELPRPCLADLVAKNDWTTIDRLYSTHKTPGVATHGVHAENWCAMPHRGQTLYLAVDAGPVYDDSGELIAVVETLHDLTEKKLAEARVQEQARLLQRHFEENEREAELARAILDHQIRSDLLAASGVRHFVNPASHFSGDLILAARAPTGRLYAILADATGHGLSAAVSVLPMVQEFYRMVEIAMPLAGIVESINFLLANSLPVGRFVAAAIISVDERSHQGEVWVGGVPDVLLLDQAGQLLRRFSSRNLPLGVTRLSGMTGGSERFTWDARSRLVVLSDGVVEATNPSGDLFGMDRLLACLAAAPFDDVTTQVRETLASFLHGQPAHDDMSLLTVDCPD